MPDGKETATTMWQDRHSGKRGHELMTKKLGDAIPALYANEHVSDYDAVLAHAKLFSPYSRWTWYVTEWNAKTGECFGLVDGLEQEIGYFDLTELAETTVQGGVPAVERDLYWQAKTLGEIRSRSHGDSTHKAGIREGDTMNDDTGTEGRHSDVVNVEEFLFGGVTEETADDTPAEVAGELLSGDETDEVGGAETTEGPDAEADAANEETDVADDADDQTAADGTESPEDLKVVLTIRGGRAIIGVQQPSADSHIESFDGLDLLGLALQVPQVVERARARWEQAPKYPAYEKPTPPARRQRQRRQAPVEAETEQGETEQEQPETLRLF